MSGVLRLSPLRFKFCIEVIKLWLVSNCELLFLLKTCPSHITFQRENNSQVTFTDFLFSFAFLGKVTSYFGNKVTNTLLLFILKEEIL